MEMQHFLHEHVLKLIEKEEDYGMRQRCNGCQEALSGQIYACDLCQFFLHESCANLPREIKHFFHQCPLFLKFRRHFWCFACGKYYTSPLSYRCDRCDFEMDVECTRFKPISPDDEEERIQHFSHHHPLKHVENGEKNYEVFDCNACGRLISGQTYACELCGFFLHESCANHLPQQIQHRCHPCPLFLTFDQYFTCNTCLEDKSKRPSYQCRPCKFAMDVECSQLSAISPIGEAEQILHFCHHHPLQLLTNMKVDSKNKHCPVCESLCLDPTYGCEQCDIYIHISCLDILPLTIQEPTPHPSIFVLLRIPIYWCSDCGKPYEGFAFRRPTDHDYLCVRCALSRTISYGSPSFSLQIQHPSHPCSLTLKFFFTFNCKSCSEQCSSHAYYCRKCGFYMGVKCAQLPEEEHIQHFCHSHPLKPFWDKSRCETSCKICRNLTSETSYCCSKCDFYIHKSCLDILPEKIDVDHRFDCTLVLLTTSSYICEACNKECSGLTFCSIEGGFKLCIECTLWPENRLADNGMFQSIHHLHQLALSEKASFDDVCCFLCREQCSGPVYGCSKCNASCHKSCAELPQEIQHPFHPLHALSLTSRSALDPKRGNCTLCLKDPSLGFLPYLGLYYCKECNFQLDIRCAIWMPSIEYQGHPHLLTVVENFRGEEICQRCKTDCKGLKVFHCVECKFNLHLLCGPLPVTIKHQLHVHDLVLEEFYVEDNETDVFACHICEKERNPRLRVYRCAEKCLMICDVECVKSEVIPSLRGERGVMELKTAYPYSPSKVVISKDSVGKLMKQVLTIDNNAFFLKNALGSFNEFEQKTVDRIIAAVNETTREYVEANASKDGHVSVYSFSEESFSHFMNKLIFPMLQFNEPPDFIIRHNGSTMTGEYSLPRTLLPIFEEVFSKYQIINSNCISNFKIKSLCVFYICAVLHDMRLVKMVDVRKERINQWLGYLWFALHARFKVKFVFKHVKHIAQAHFLIQAKELVDETSSQLQTEVDGLSELETEQRRQLEATSEKLSIAEKSKKKHSSYRISALRRFKKECKDVLEVKWRPAFHGIGEI